MVVLEPDPGVVVLLPLPVVSLEEPEWPFLLIPLWLSMVSVLDELPVVLEVVLLPEAFMSPIAPLFFFFLLLFLACPVVPLMPS